MHPPRFTLLQSGLLLIALAVGAGASTAAADEVPADSAQDLLAQVDHYRCYEAKQRDPSSQPAGLQDVFLQGPRSVLEIVQLCAPVRKIRPDLMPPEDLLPRFPLAHLVCYRLAPRENPDAEIEIRNQFETDRARVGEERVLCVPSLKRHLPIDDADGFPSRELAEQQLAQVEHYRCYRARQQNPAEEHAVLRDQFLGPDPRRVRKLVEVCTPVRKIRPEIGEALIPRFPEVRLACYALRPRDTADARVRIWNQFETDALQVGEERALCVPSLMRALGAGPPA